jgi:hypothetical protein
MEELFRGGKIALCERDATTPARIGSRNSRSKVHAGPMGGLTGSRRVFIVLRENRREEQSENKHRQHHEYDRIPTAKADFVTRITGHQVPRLRL